MAGNIYTVNELDNLDYHWNSNGYRGLVTIPKIIFNGIVGMNETEKN